MHTTRTKRQRTWCTLQRLCKRRSCTYGDYVDQNVGLACQRLYTYLLGYSAIKPISIILLTWRLAHNVPSSHGSKACDNTQWNYNSQCHLLQVRRGLLPYFGKRKQVSYHLNPSYWCFCILPSVLFFQAKFYASKLILLRDMLGKTPWYSIDVSGNETHFALLQEMSLLSLASFCQSRAAYLCIAWWEKVDISRSSTLPNRRLFVNCDIAVN